MLFLWLYSYLVMAVATSPSAGADSRESPRTFCGRTLADARMLYCMSAEASTIFQKRQVPDLLGEGDVYKEKRGLFPFNTDDAVWPWLPLQGRDAQALRSRSRDKRMPGLVDECCLKPCYLSELLSYC